MYVLREKQVVFFFFLIVGCSVVLGVGFIAKYEFLKSIIASCALKKNWRIIYECVEIWDFFLICSIFRLSAVTFINEFKWFY